jgi:hypothetical protein
MLPRLMCAALAVTLLYAPARAEKDHDRDRDEKKQPELRIRLHIAPAVFPPRHKDREHDRDDAAVIYKLAPAAEEFSVRKEFRPMLIEGGRQEQVELTTIVVK